MLNRYELEAMMIRALARIMLRDFLPGGSIPGDPDFCDPGEIDPREVPINWPPRFDPSGPGKPGETINCSSTTTPLYGKPPKDQPPDPEPWTARLLGAELKELHRVKMTGRYVVVIIVPYGPEPGRYTWSPGDPLPFGLIASTPTTEFVWTGEHYDIGDGVVRVYIRKDIFMEWLRAEPTW